MTLARLQAVEHVDRHVGWNRVDDRHNAGSARTDSREHESDSMAWLVAAELAAGILGFGVTVGLARRLGTGGFATFEFASAVSAWLLVVVRGSLDTIVTREASRRPRLLRSLMGLLFGLRLALACVCLGIVAILASATTNSTRFTLLIASLVLIPSSLACDVGLRISGRFRALALAQVARIASLAIATTYLVAPAGNPSGAAGCVILAECTCSLFLMMFHLRDQAMPWPCIRRRAWFVLARRGAVTGAIRFGRVSLYACDVLTLGAVGAFGALGSYAAARRVTLAMLAVGLVVPTAIAPAVARAWLIGREEARILIYKSSTTLMRTAWPATVGLAMTADRWMPLLFGERYREGGPWLALLVARTPFILESNLQQAVLIACRREREALLLVGMMVSLAALVLPLAAVLDGPRSVGLVMLAIEAGGAIAGAHALANLGVAPARRRDVGGVLAGCAGMTLVCGLGHAWPLPYLVILSMFVYGVILVLLSRPEWFTWSRGRARA